MSCLNWIHAWFICLLLWLRWSGLSLSAWQSHSRFISISVGVGEEGGAFRHKTEVHELDAPLKQTYCEDCFQSKGDER
jgi:hypothetical protein